MKGKECLVFLVLIFCVSLVSGASVSLSSGVVSISDADNLYAYEINFDYTGSITNVVFGSFLGAGTSSGHSERNSISSIYESKLDSTATGVSGDGTLFTVTYIGEIGLESAVLIANDTAETTINYACGNGVCTSSESCSTCPSDCGACPVTTTTAPSGGGGGGGGAAVSVPGISIDVSNINMDLVLNSNKERIIRVTNTGEVATVVNLGQIGLSGIAIIEGGGFTLAPGESRDVRILFIALSETGIYTGKIFIAGKAILVSINMRSKQLLFDALVVVPDDEKLIKLGDRLDVQITLIPMGDDPRVDVTLNYLIKDFDGKIYVQESETILIEKQESFQKEFFTEGLPVGNYIVGLELVYPNGVATSSSHFEIVKEKPLFSPFSGLSTVLIFLIIGVVVLVVLIIMFMVRYKKRKKNLLRRR